MCRFGWLSSSPPSPWRPTSGWVNRVGTPFRLVCSRCYLPVICGFPDDQVSDVFYVALLRYLGCTADASEVARLAGDEIGLAVAVGP